MTKCSKSSKKNDYRPKGFAKAMSMDSNMGMNQNLRKKQSKKKK